MVAGGGPAGLGVALAVARRGASVVLLERYGFLGGNFTAASPAPSAGCTSTPAPASPRSWVGIAEEFTDRLAADGAGVGPVPFKRTVVFVYVPWAAKRLADHLVTGAGIDLLLHVVVADAVVTDGRLDAVVVATKQGLQAVRGRVFVDDDAGDVDVATFAGVPTAVLGDPGHRQHASMQFVLQHADPERGDGRDRDARSRDRAVAR